MPLDDEGEDTNSGKDDEISVQFTHKGYWRAKGCWLMCDKEDSECAACTDYMECVKNASKEKGDEQVLYMSRHLSQKQILKELN